MRLWRREISTRTSLYCVRRLASGTVGGNTLKRYLDVGIDSFIPLSQPNNLQFRWSTCQLRVETCGLPLHRALTSLQLLPNSTIRFARRVPFALCGSRG